MSGYDIKRLLKSLNWLVGSPSFGTLYPTLHDGLVSVTAGFQGSRRAQLALDYGLAMAQAELAGGGL